MKDKIKDILNTYDKAFVPDKILGFLKENQWIKVNDRLPEPEQKVIAFYKNPLGKGRTIMAFHAPKFTCGEYIDDDDVTEYDEATDVYYLKEGWYEDNEFEEIHYFVDGNVTHWMPLPSNPEEVWDEG